MTSPHPGPVQLSVSIVLYNSPLDLLQRVLISLYRSARRAEASGRLDQVVVYIMDNSSDQALRDGVHEALAGLPGSDFFQVTYRALDHNGGFGAGHNVVLGDLVSDYHLVLNPDAELSEDTLQIGLSSLQDDDSIALVSPWVAAEDGRQEFLCKRFPSVLVLLLRAFAPRFLQRLFHKRLYHYEMRDVCKGEDEGEIMLASGCFMLVRTEALRQAGGFNENYFLYFEDFDLSLRLGGHGRLVFNPAMRIVHHGGYAARKGMLHVRYFIRSGILFFNQHGWRWI